MAQVSIHKALLQDMLFGFTPNPVEIRNSHFDYRNDCVVFEIAGPDVPDKPEATVTVTLETNRAGDKLRKMTFA